MVSGVKRCSACALLLTGGLVSGLGLYVGVFCLLVPVLLFGTFLYAHYVALVLAAAGAVSVFAFPRRCGAPMWCQRDKAWFWLGTCGVLLYVCATI